VTGNSLELLGTQMTPAPQQGTVGIGSLRAGVQRVTEEFAGASWPVVNDTLAVSLEPRSFAMIGF